MAFSSAAKFSYTSLFTSHRPFNRAAVGRCVPSDLRVEKQFDRSDSATNSAFCLVLQSAGETCLRYDRNACLYKQLFPLLCIHLDTSANDLSASISLLDLRLSVLGLRGNMRQSVERTSAPRVNLSRRCTWMKTSSFAPGYPSRTAGKTWYSSETLACPCHAREWQTAFQYYPFWNCIGAAKDAYLICQIWFILSLWQSPSSYNLKMPTLLWLLLFLAFVFINVSSLDEGA